MKALIYRIFIQNWPRKAVAFLSAVVIWFLVNQSITINRTFPDVAIRVINLPQDKTVVGLLPNGLLNKRTSVTIAGTKSVITDLRNSDIEVVINAEGKAESWMAKIDRRSIVNLSSEWDLMKSITDVSGSDVFIKMSKLVIEDIPINITSPVGDPPSGFQFLNVSPKTLQQRVSGPEEQVMALKKEGIDIAFNLDLIAAAELTSLATNSKTDELSFYVPSSWKQVEIPFRDNAAEPLNDPRAKNLRLDFLKQELVPLGEMLPVSVFFPLKYSKSLNPEHFTIAANDFIEQRNGINVLKIPLYVRDVSRLFLDVVKENIELTVIAVPRSVQKNLHWTIEVINEKALEDEFVAISLEHDSEKYLDGKTSEEMLRNRFREYLHKLVLYIDHNRPLALRADLSGNTIYLHFNPN